MNPLNPLMLMAQRSQVPIDRRQYVSEGGWIALVRMILTASGPVGLMAIGLTVFLTYSVWGRLDRIEANQMTILESMRQANVSMSTFVAANNEMNRERAALMAQQVRLLRQLCINAAERDSQAKACSD